MKGVKVLISIINWNNYLATKASCIESIINNNYGNYKIVVLDNASVDDSYEELVNNFSELEVVKSEENLGFAGGHKLVWDSYVNLF